MVILRLFPGLHFLEKVRKLLTVYIPLFSIEIGRYPDNRTDFKVITDKLIKATDIAISKGGNRYIIYKEDIHGEL